MDEIELTATNYGIIEAENATVTWRKYWDNVEFILPGNGVEEDGFVTIELGDLPANSTVSVTIQVKLLWRIPAGRELESWSDYMVLWPEPDDPSWVTGPVLFLEPRANPVEGRIKAKISDDPEVVRFDYLYFFENRTLMTFGYDDNGMIVDQIVTENATEPEDRRRFLLAEDRRHRFLAGPAAFCARDRVMKILRTLFKEGYEPGELCRRRRTVTLNLPHFG